jgi:hypothetical protein
MFQGIVKAALPVVAAAGFIAMTATSTPAFTLFAPSLDKSVEASNVENAYYGWGWRRPWGYGYGWGWRRPWGYGYGWGWPHPWGYGYGWGWRRPWAYGYRWGWRRPWGYGWGGPRPWG